jgi:hypothetical protein
MLVVLSQLCKAELAFMTKFTVSGKSAIGLSNTLNLDVRIPKAFSAILLDQERR